MTARNRTSVTTGAAVVGASILVASALTPQQSQALTPTPCNPPR